MHKKWSLPLTISSVNVTSVNDFTFTEEILNGKLHFLCSLSSDNCEHIWDVYETLSNIYDGAFA